MPRGAIAVSCCQTRCSGSNALAITHTHLHSYVDMFEFANKYDQQCCAVSRRVCLHTTACNGCPQLLGRVLAGRILYAAPVPEGIPVRGSSPSSVAV